MSAWADEAAIAISIAATLGETSEVKGSLVGEVLARAQLLANRARPGELVLGPSAREALGAYYRSKGADLS